MSRQDNLRMPAVERGVESATLAGEIPDYEAYDFSSVWKGRGIANEAEKALVRRWAEGGGESSLDLGGGFGRIAQVLESRFEKPFLLDYSMRNLRIASRWLAKTSLIRCDLARPLPFDGMTFDFITLIRVGHHIEDPGPLLSEVARVARDGATFVLGIANELPLRDITLTRQELLTTSSAGHRIYTTPTGVYAHPNLVRDQIRGVGLFDNRIGRKLERLTQLWKVDVATSRLWPAKPMLFLKFRVVKQGGGGGAGGMNEPIVRCYRCRAKIADHACAGCGRVHGRIIDLVGGGGGR